MSGLDEVDSEFPECDCGNYMYWVGMIVGVPNFEKEVYFMPLKHKGADLRVVKYDKYYSKLINVTNNELNYITEIWCDSCGSDVSYPKRDGIIKIARKILGYEKNE